MLAKLISTETTNDLYIYFISIFFPFPLLTLNFISSLLIAFLGKNKPVELTTLRQQTVSVNHKKNIPRVM